MAAFVAPIGLASRVKAVGVLTALPGRDGRIDDRWCHESARQSAWVPGAVRLRASARRMGCAGRAAEWRTGPTATHATPATAVCNGEGGEEAEGRPAGAHSSSFRRGSSTGGPGVAATTDKAVDDEVAAFPHMATVAAASAVGGGQMLMTLSLPAAVVDAAGTPGMFLDLHLGNGCCRRAVIAASGSGKDAAVAVGVASHLAGAGVVQLLLPAVEASSLLPPGRALAVSDPGGAGVDLDIASGDTSGRSLVLFFVDSAHGLAIARSVVGWTRLPATTSVRVYVAAGADGGVAEAAGGVLPPTTLTGGPVSAVSVNGERMARRLAAEAAMSFGGSTSLVGVVALADAAAVEEVCAVMGDVESLGQLVVFAPLGGDAGQFEVDPRVAAAADSVVEAGTAAAAAAAAVDSDFIGGDDELSSPTWAAAAAAASTSVAAASAAPGAAFWDGAPGFPAGSYDAFDDDFGWQSPFEEAVWRQWTRVREEMAAEYARRYAYRAASSASDGDGVRSSAPAWEAWFAANAAAWEAAAWDADVWSAYNDVWTADPTPDAGGDPAADARRWAAYGSRRKGTDGRTYNSYGRSGWGTYGGGGTYAGDWRSGGGYSSSYGYGSSSYSSSSGSSSSSSSWGSAGGSTMDDYFTLLGVSATSTAKEVKVAYRKAAKRWHPDQNLGNEAACTAMMKKVVVAYTAIRQYHGSRR
ncbi:hypothetical protein MMPV_001624 [Pyropia vietnamensis]